MFASMVLDFSNKENECSSAHTLGEDFAWTGSRIASELADTQNQLHVAACTGHISYETGIVAADMCRCMSAKWADTVWCTRFETDGQKLV